MTKVGNLFGRSSRTRGAGTGPSPSSSASSLRGGGSGSNSHGATPPSAFSVESVNGSPLEGQDLGQPDLYYIFAAVNDCCEMMEKVHAPSVQPVPPLTAARQVQALEEEHSALAEEHSVDFEMVQKVLSQGGMKGCTYLIEILMGDLYPLLDQLFPATGPKGDQEVVRWSPFPQFPFPSHLGRGFRAPLRWRPPYPRAVPAGTPGAHRCPRSSSR